MGLEFWRSSKTTTEIHSERFTPFALPRQSDVALVKERLKVARRDYEEKHG